MSMTAQMLNSNEIIPPMPMQTKNGSIMKQVFYSFLIDWTTSWCLPLLTSYGRTRQTYGFPPKVWRTTMWRNIHPAFLLKYSRVVG